MITENLSTLKIHKLTQEQYDRELEAGNIDSSALYLTPEEVIDLSGYATKEEMEAKANASHVHTASNITSGTLSIDRLPTISIAKGGTGATDATTARENLKITPANIGAAVEDHTHNRLNCNNDNGNIRVGYETNSNGGYNYYFRKDAIDDNDAYILGSASNYWDRAYIDELTISQSITLNNGNSIKAKDSNGDIYNMLYLSSNNRLQLGYGLPETHYLQINPFIRLSSKNYGATLPDAGTSGRIFFKKVN